jgi:hypothetical protein
MAFQLKEISQLTGACWAAGLECTVESNGAYQHPCKRLRKNWLELPGTLTIQAN